MSYLPMIKDFEEKIGWANFQINSFNNFVKTGMQKIIDEIDIVTLTPELGDLKLKFGKVVVSNPIIKEADGSTRHIFPSEARVRNLTYSAPVFVTITPIINGIQEKSEKVHIGDLPIMVKSCLCSSYEQDRNKLIEMNEDPNDPGGYFIVNGTERVLVLIEEITSNKPIFEKSKDEISVRINSEKSGFKQRHIIERNPEGDIFISFANIRKLSVFVLLKALGLETDKEICDNISDNQKILSEIYTNLFETEVSNKEEAIESIGKKLRVTEDYREERVKQILDRYLLPHIGQDIKNRYEKAQFLTKIIKRIVALSLGLVPSDDIDHYSNKRLLTSEELLGQLFRSILLGRWGLLAKMTYNYQKLIKRGKHPTIQGIIEANAVTKQVISSIATGNWIGGRTGISQRLDRSSYIKTISHLRSIISPLTSTQEHFNARQIHPTEWGRLCPAETPEGSSIGLRKHLAILTEITTGLNEEDNEKIAGLINSLS
ncbi:MAG: DNA-directed RNA polymerase subunit B'' [Nanoarchaeota archaeon]|nr:DNA-directed RNA polymerase subunit B'' [Nanoarchaeota archaeon]MBU1135791.1 DNA-directed RNA polymerase subunit B'' [Nanoarchaeota archaeon]MBU2519645.1 DNA-directed RNA polymerase subunit B'' [Nanoarchaeota archaeon]